LSVDGCQGSTVAHAGEVLDEELSEVGGERCGGIVMDSEMRFSAVMHICPVVLEHRLEVMLSFVGWGSAASLGAVEDHWRTSSRKSLSESSTYAWFVATLCFFITTMDGGMSAALR